MKSLLLILVTSIITTSTFADTTRNLGRELGLMPNSVGEPSFGVQYTYCDDRDGKTYLVLFTPSLSSDEKTKHFLWNFYIAGSADFLLPWDDVRDTQLSIVSLGLQDKTAVEQILKNQSLKNGKNMLSLVFVDRETKVPVYYLPISQLCADIPTHFADLTNGKSCDQIINP